MKLKESVLSECEKESQLGLDEYEFQQLRSLKGLRDVYPSVGEDRRRTDLCESSDSRSVFFIGHEYASEGHQRHQPLPQGRAIDEKSH